MHCKIHSEIPKSYQNKIAISLSTDIIGITENYSHLQKIQSQNTVVCGSEWNSKPESPWPITLFNDTAINSWAHTQTQITFSNLNSEMPTWT